MKNKFNLHVISDSLYFLKIIWKIHPRRVIFSFVGQIFSYMEWAFFSVVFMKYLFGCGIRQRLSGDCRFYCHFHGGDFSHNRFSDLDEGAV